MNSPYMGNFRVSQPYKGTAHKGIDLVGVDSKEIHSTVNGIVEVASNADPKGFGIYVRIKQDVTGDKYYFGHMSKVCCVVGDHVNVADIIGIEGSTGQSTGSHCHYEVRRGGTSLDISAISGIQNKIGTYNDGHSSTPQPTLSNLDVTYQVHTTKWLPDVVNDSDYAGIENHPITCLLAQPSVGTLTYQVHVLGGGWLPTVTNRTDWAGINGKVIDGLRMHYDVDGRDILYRVSLVGNTGYLPWVQGDSDYAGIYGKAIDKIQMKIV